MMKKIFAATLIGLTLGGLAACSKKPSTYKYHYTPMKINKVVGRSEVKLPMNDRVQRWINYFTGPSRSRFTRYMERSGRYIPLMKQILKEHNIPEDVVYIAMIESGFTARARSHANAVGFWQFIGSTGKRYGLRIDPYVDERMDPVKSTRAAANYLVDLYNEFGDWHTAFAGYNSGEGKVRGGIEKYGTRNYWHLTDRHRHHFKAETKDYVPKYIAAALIAKNPKKYGFNHVNYQKPLQYDIVKINSQTDIDVITKCTRAPYEEIELLNAELVMGITPPDGQYEIKVPKGTAARFLTAFAKIPKEQRLTRKPYEVTEPSYHYVKKGETLGRIARKYNVSTKSLMAANGMKRAGKLTVGQKLTIPGRQVKAKKTFEKVVPEEAAVVVGTVETTPASSGGIEAVLQDTASGSVDTATTAEAAVTEGKTVAKDVKYTIKRGDTLSSIAKKHGVTVSKLQAWNNIKGVNIQAGKTIIVSKKEVFIPTTVVSLSEKDVKTRGSQSGLSTYKVRRGDTLYAIALRNDMSVAELSELNNISRKALLKPGMVLKVKAPKAIETPRVAVTSGSDEMIVSRAESAPQDDNPQTLSLIKYKVKKGDTAWDIAKKHNVTLNDIQGWNSGTDLKRIKPGDIIKIKPAVD